jgi:hypothetical protein
VNMVAAESDDLLSVRDRRVANPSDDWCGAYADWYFQGRS